MSESFKSGYSLYEKLVESPCEEIDVVSILSQFKGHVKKELVDVSSIPNYFKGLFYALDKGQYSTEDSSRILILAHSSLCYLVKRVAMQCVSFLEDNEMVNVLIIHLFLLGSQGPVQLEGRNFWISSTRALEAIQLLEPQKVQSCILKLLKDESLQRRKILLVMDEVLQISEKKMNLEKRLEIWQEFAPRLLEFLNDDSSNDSDSLAPLVCDIILKNEGNDKEQLRHWIPLLRKQSHKDLLKSAVDDSSRPNSQPLSLAESKSSLALGALDVNEELQVIFQEFQIFSNYYSNDYEIEVFGLNQKSLESLKNLLESLLQPFEQPKETEKNWKLRQENLSQLRKLLRNEFISKEHPIEFLCICKDLQLMECVGKAALSLRTTLSTTGCLVIKDFLQIMPSKLDSTILDQMFESLKTLLSSSKKMSSTNAFNCLVIMFSHIDFHHKLFQNCFMLINQKSIVPKNCSAILLRIFIIKFHHTTKLENSLVYIEEWLKKGITDAQTFVREAMRKTFWYYYKCYPNQAKKFLHSQLSSQLRKAVELSIPERLQIDYQVTSSANSSAPSSFPNSRRTSLGPKKFPSYAQPTQSSYSSSNSLLQRASNVRSTSEYVLRENNINAPVNATQNGRRKTSAPPQLAKRSLTTVDPQEKQPRQQQQQQQQQEPQDLPQQPSHHHHHHALSNRAETTDNSLQIDLTGDVSPSRSSSLINKHIGLQIGDGKDNLELMYQFLESPSTMKIKDGLQILQNSLLTSSASMNSAEEDNAEQDVDFDRLLPLIRNVMIKLPQDLKPLLLISKFWQSIPLKYLIELYAINFLTFSDELLKYFPSDVLLCTILETLSYLDPSIIDQKNEMSPSLSLHYMKYKQFIFNFCFHLLIQVLHAPNVDAGFLEDPLSQGISKLAQLYGQEYDETLYFDTLHEIYRYNSTLFVQKIHEVPYVSTKLKICDQLESRDKDSIFHREDIVSRQSLDGTEYDQLFLEEPKDNEVVDDHRVMEMTMVNPFNQVRTASGGSVVHHDPSLPEFSSHAVGQNEKREGTDHRVEHIEEEDQKRLSEITKVVSIYQPIDQENIDPIQHGSGAKSDQDVEMLDSPRDLEPNVNLSEIFGNSQEGTVKFSTDPPKIINSSRVPSSSIENVKEGEIRTLTRNVSMERDKSPVTPLTDHQSKELSNAINSIDIGKKHGISLSHEAKNGSNLSAEILANAIRDRENGHDGQTPEFDLLEAVSNDSLVFHEISNAYTVTEGFEDVEQLLDQMKKAITRIESRSFTMKHLNVLIAPLICRLREKSIRNWLESENGYHELLRLSQTLFHSTDETEIVPVNLACKSIVLIECLVLINGYLRSVVPISSLEFKTIWGDALAMINKLPEYSCEIYCLLQEFRDLLVFLNFFDTKDTSSMLRALISEVQEGTSGIKETFLMETLAIVVSKAQTALKPNQILEIVRVMQLYVESNRADWRFASCEVLSQISQHLVSVPGNNPAEVDFDHLLEGLSHGRQRVIEALSSR